MQNGQKVLTSSKDPIWELAQDQRAMAVIQKTTLETETAGCPGFEMTMTCMRLGLDVHESPKPLSLATFLLF